MSTEYSVEEVRATFEREDRYFVIKKSHHNADQLAALERLFDAWKIRTVQCVVVESDWPEHETVWAMIEARMADKPAQAAQVDDKVVVIRDGQATTEGLVLAAAIYMGAVKDIFALRSDGPPYNERKVTKDTGALRAFNHLDAATKALRSAISHFAPTAEPVVQGEVVDVKQTAEYSYGYQQALQDTAAQPRAVPKLDAEDWAVLQRLRNALPDVGLNGWHRGVTVLSKLLAAASSPGESK